MEKEVSKGKSKFRINMVLWWGFLIIYLEMIYRIFVVGDFLSINTLYVLLFSIPWIMGFSVITTLFNSKINRFFNVLFSLLVCVLFLSQTVFYYFYQSMFSIYSLANGTGQVMQFWERILEVMLGIWYIFLLVLVPVILAFIFHKKIFNYKRSKYYIILIYLVILNLSVIGIILLSKYDKGMYNLDTLLHKTHAPMLTINKTGLLTMEAIDVYRYAFGFEEQVVEEEEEEIPEEAEIKEDVEYNVKNIDFDALIKKTTNKKVKSMIGMFWNCFNIEEIDMIILKLFNQLKRMNILVCLRVRM